MNWVTRFNYAVSGMLCIALAAFCSCTPIPYHYPPTYTVILRVILCSLLVTGVVGIHLACRRNLLKQILACFD